MSTPNNVGILIFGHGSKRPEANAWLVTLVQRVADRLPELDVRVAFFSLANPSIEERIAAMVSQGIQKIYLLPYFLYDGIHITVDLPEQLEECRKQYPSLELEVLPTLQGEALLEDCVTQRLALLAPPKTLPTRGKAIEQLSHDLIDRRLRDRFPAGVHSVVRRVIHATADFSFADSMRFHPQAVEKGVEAIAAGKPVICDARMVRSGITRTAGKALCAISDPDVIEQAKATGNTRAATAMDKLSEHFEGAIVVIGNAPTALFRLLHIAANGGPRPALVVGLPVGFVGAHESKEALINSDLCYIANVGPRGGSSVAAASINALALLTREKTHVA